jgi:hypothetical protein
MNENVLKDTGFNWGQFFHWIDKHPWVAITLIFYIVTAVLSYKRDKSFWAGVV